MSKLTLPNKKVGETHATGNRPDDKQGATFGTGNDDKIKRLEAIADAADGAREGEFTDIDEVPRETTEEPVEASEDAPPDDTQAVETPKKYKIPVNGEMREFTEDQLIAAASKVTSADEYLRISKESVKTAAELALSPQDEQAPEETDFRALARALQMGTEEEAEQALRKLTKPKLSKTPDVSQLVRSELTLRDAKAKFDEDFKDVLTDPYLAELVAKKDKDLYEADPNTPYDTRWRKAGEEIRTWAKGFKNVSSLDKATRKAQVAPVPSASGRQVTTDADEGEDRPENVIAEMARARKQERPVKH